MIYVSNIRYEDEELEENRTIKDFLVVRLEALNIFSVNKI